MIVLQPTFFGNDFPLDHPHVGWRRMAGTVSATSETAGFAAVNAGTYRTDSFWRPDAMPATWTLTPAAAGPISYIGIAAHDLATQGCTVTAEIEVASVWEEVGEIAPDDNEPILFLFLEKEATAFRVTVSGGTGDPTIAVIQGGPVTAWPRKATYAPSVSMQRATQTGYDTNLTDGGQWAGRSVVRRELRPQMAVEHLPEDWIEAEFDAFAEHARANPFFVADKPGSYPRSLAYAFATGDLIPDRQLANRRAANSVTLELQGFRGRV